ncbi:TonB-dependent receptor [Chitinophaga niabensis]|uniref:TonB-dependent receptor n=1 Tax=Chitinophaga niabensis TaxID=536979 RepID=UPI0031BA583E
MNKRLFLLASKPDWLVVTRLMRVVKLTTFLLIVANFCANAKTFAQITMSQRNVSLEKVFKEIHRKTGYQFFYKDELLKEAKKVDIDVKDASIEEVLDICFKDQPFGFTITQKTITVVRKNAVKVVTGHPSPPVVIKGKVTDFNGVGLAGVSVSVIGSTTGVFTDIDGNFTITVPDNSVLSFTFIGFKTENLRVGKENATIAVMLTQQVSSLNDVVVVGYGTQKKVSVVGAVTSIGTNELRQSPTTNLSNALAGRLPGLLVNQFVGGEPGVDQSDVFIRGMATYNTGNNSQKPIVIVDGIERDFQYLNPEEVETFSLLKDASATAVFGVRGANGVILVTTRRGKLMDKPNVTFKAAGGVSAPIKFPEYLGSADYAMLYNEAQDNDKSTRTRFTAEAIENFKKAKGDNSDGLGYNIDLFDYAFKPSMQQDYSLNIQGGNKTVKYFVMAGYMNQDGNYKHTKLSPYNTNAVFKRYNFRSNIDINITDNFYARLNLGGRIQNRIAPGTTAARVVNIANTQPSIYPIILENNENPANKSHIYKHPEGLLFGTQLYRYNILGEIAYSGFINEYKTFMDGSFALGHKLDFITKGLTFEVQYSYDVQSGNTVNRTIPHESEGYREYGGYATFYPQAGVDIFMNPTGGHYEGAYITPKRSDNATMNNGYDGNTPGAQRKNHLQVTLNYARSFGKHSVSGMLLGLRQRRTLTNEVPFGNQGLAFRATYNYNDRYLFEFNAGYNGSENFPKGARYGFFPAVAAGWVISNENFMENSVINYLKVRGSYGLVGSDLLPGIRFGYLQFFEVNGDTYNFGIGQNNGAPANVYEAPLANRALTWEKAKKANIGVEARTLNNRLSLTVDVFKEHRYDILTNIPNDYGTRNVSAVVGQNAPQLNLGVVDNKGFDLEVGWSDNIGKSFSYYIRPNVSFARNKIIYINEIERIAANGKNVDYARRTGKRIGEQFVFEFSHFVKDQAEADALNASNYQKWGALIPGDVVYKDQNGDGQITDQEDRIAMGNPRNPEIQFGIPMGVSYKSFDVSILFQGATNTSVQLINAAAWDFPTYGQDIIGRVKKFHLARWTPATAATATYPALHYGTHLNNKNPNSSLFLADASYMRLKSLEIGYSLSPKFLKRLGLAKTRFYAQGLNLATWDKLSTFDVDPETNTGGDWYPIQKVYNLGVYVTF